MAERPTGIVTFLFTDIEGSTHLWEQSPEAMRHALARHDTLLRQVIEAHGGYIFKTVGDAFCAAFATAPNALAAALAAQRALTAATTGEENVSPPAADVALRVRMGIHTGAAEFANGDYAGLTLSRVQRVMAAGYGGQILLSSAAREAVGNHLDSDVTLRDLGRYRLRGLTQAEAIFQLVAPDLPPDFPPLRAATDADGMGATPGALLQRLGRGQLVGRQRELSQLRQCWAQAQQSVGQLVLLSGEPGVGKTRLGYEVIGQAQADGATILRGGCYEYEATSPYLPFVEALRAYVHAQPIDSLRIRLGSSAPELARLAPEIDAKIGPLTPSPSLSPNDERLRLFDNVARFLAALSRENGLLLFLDDLHWVDQATLTLLHYVLRTLSGERLLALATYRDVELDRSHPLAAALVEWRRERLATRIPLSPLSLTETGSLVAMLLQQAQVSSEFAEAIYHETEGNPFFVEEVVKSLIEQGQIYREDDTWQRKAVAELTIPQSIKEAIGRRLNRLSQACAEALHTAAALGKTFPFAALAAVSALDEDALLDALDEGSAAQLIRPDKGDSFAFTHDKIREVLVEELNPVRRRRLHQRIGEALEQLYTTQLDDHAPDLAYHFVQSGDWQKGLAYSLRAAAGAERVFAHDDALAHLEVAEECAETLGQPDSIAAIAEMRGDILNRQDLVEPTIANYQHALDRASDAEARALLMLKMAHAYTAVGDERGQPLLEAAIKDLDPTTQANELAQAIALQGRLYHYHAREAEALAALKQALRLAEPQGDPATLQTIYGYLAGVYQHQLQFDESLAWARKSIALGERHNYPLATAVGYEFLAENEWLLGRFHNVLAHTARECEVAERIGARARLGWALWSRANALHDLGDLVASEAAAREALAHAEATSELRLQVWASGCLAITQANLGKVDEAVVTARWATTRADELGQVSLQAWSRRAGATIHLQAGEWAAAAEMLDEVATLVAATDNRNALLLLGDKRAEAYLGLARLADAEQVATAYLAVTGEARSAAFDALGQLALARVQAAQGRHEVAARTFDDTVESLRTLDARLDLGRALYHRANLRRDLGQRDEARADLTHARDLFATCGAPHDLRLAEAALAGVGPDATG